MSEQTASAGSQGVSDTQLPPSATLTPVTLTTPPVSVQAETLVPTQGPVAPLPRECLGRFEVHGEIGRGGMGAVLRARDPVLGRELAVKVLLGDHRDDAETQRRFRDEAQIGGQLQHPGLVPVYDFGADA